jgi:hypothetical protein
MVNMFPIPDQFKQYIAKAKYQNILNGFFAQIVIDAVNLDFLQHTTDVLI